MKIKTTTEVEIDITFPAYFLHGSSYYKILSEVNGIAVCTETNNEEIRTIIYDSVIELVVTGGKKSTAEAFNDAFASTLAHFSSLSEVVDVSNISQLGAEC